MPPVVPVVDEYRLHRLTCPRCRTSTCATLPPGVPTGAFGPRLRAILGVLAGGYRLGKRPIRQFVFDLLGLTISTGMIARLERRGAEELEAPVEELRQFVRTAAVAHIDETSWWQGRDKAWLWAAVTKWVTVFTVAASRGAGVARHMLGADARRWSSAIGSRAMCGSSGAGYFGPISTGISRRWSIGAAKSALVLAAHFRCARHDARDMPRAGIPRPSGGPRCFPSGRRSDAGAGAGRPRR